jgi:hypothetical protein
MNASYPSPTTMAAAPLPPMPSANMVPAPMVHPELPPNLMPGIPAPTYQPAEARPQPPAKQFPCSTCGKPFARRSDLARHGRPQAAISRFAEFPLTGLQSVFTAGSALTSAISLAAASSLSNALL